MTDPTQLYAELLAAFQRRRWRKAQELATRLLPFAPQHAGVHGIAGVISMELQQTARAAELLRRATELDPARADFATLYAKALSMDRQAGAAVQAAERALALAPEDSAALDTLGVICAQNHAHARAVTAFRRAIAQAPRQASHRFNLATSLVAMGDIDAAEQEFESCIALDPACWRAHLSLSQLRRQTPAAHHVERLLALLSRHGSDATATTCLNMALAKEYEDLGDYAKAFEHLVRGKSAGRRTRAHSMQRDTSMFAALMQVSPASVNGVGGDPSHEPIFVIGMPRTGTTLVERILSSHPDVCNAGELQNFAVALQQASGSPTPILFHPEIAALARAIDWERLGATYLSSTHPAMGRTPRFIDKLPHNFLYAGFIANALPNARIICLRRDPLDTCLGNFRQLFEQDSSHFDYSFDLLDTGRYYVLFDRLMAHWKQLLPGRILEVRYESLVEAPESNIRRLLDFCGLPWHDACLHFEANPTPVATYSAVQARSPLYRSAIHRWKNYEPQLAGLRALLTASGIELDA